MELMGSRTLRLKGYLLLSKGIERQKIQSIRDISDKSQRNYRAIWGWIKQPERVGTLDLNMFADVLLEALDYTPEELLSMPLGDLFEIVDAAEAE